MNGDEILKDNRRPDLLLNRAAYDREEVVALHFSAGPRRDAARRLWILLEESFDVDLRGLHPDDDLGELLSTRSRGSSRRQLGSFRQFVETTERRVDSLDEVEFVIWLEDRL